MKLRLGSMPSKNDLREVRRDLPSHAHFDSETREKILEEDAQRRLAFKERHKMSDFRIEVQFGSKRTARGTTVAKIRVWESAKKLTGDGDVGMMWCGGAKCTNPWSAHHLDEMVVCPHCFKTFPREEVVSELLFKRPMEEILILVAQLFYFLKGNADIVVRWIKIDVRDLDADRMDMGDWRKIEETQWEQAVYPYWRILDDTMHGQQLVNRLRDFMG